MAGDPLSHVDAAPTVLDLLGIKQGREFEQGLPVWESEQSRRKVFYGPATIWGRKDSCRGTTSPSGTMLSVSFLAGSRSMRMRYMGTRWICRTEGRNRAYQDYGKVERRLVGLRDAAIEKPCRKAPYASRGQFHQLSLPES